MASTPRANRTRDGEYFASGLACSSDAHLLSYRVRQLREEPYSQKEAEAAVGLTTDNGKREDLAMDEDELAETAAV